MELSKEEKEAIEILEKMKNFCNEYFGTGAEISTTLHEADMRKVIKVLNLISKLQKENEKQGKVIDEMAKKLEDEELYVNVNGICLYGEDCLEDCKDCIKQYFYGK